MMRMINLVDRPFVPLWSSLLSCEVALLLTEWTDQKLLDSHLQKKKNVENN